MRVLVFSILLCVLPAFGQQPGETRQEREARQRPERDLERRMADMRALDTVSRQRSEKMRAEQNAIQPPPKLDKKTKERVREARMLNAKDVAGYEAFLKGPDSGIFKIFPGDDCTDPQVVNISEKCAVPESSDFSFRAGAYTTPIYHDIGYRRGRLESEAFFTNGLLVELGDVPIDEITTESEAVRQLAAVKPGKTVHDAQQLANSVTTGLVIGDKTAVSNLEAAAGTTYLVRAIAYRLGTLIPVTRTPTMNELKFRSLSVDKREDRITVFRVIKKGDAGELLLVWRTLSKHDAPSLNFQEDEAMTDIR